MAPIAEEIAGFYRDGRLLNIGGMSRLVRAVLVLVACDSPAMRALMGFSGHSSYQNCTKCHTRGVSVTKAGASKPKPYGTDIEMAAKARTDADHRRFGTAWLRCNIKTDRTVILQEHGYRLCPFHVLPYFDSIRFHTLDPLHSWLLGSVKDFFVMLTASGWLTPEAMARMQARGDQLAVPREVRARQCLHCRYARRRIFR